MFELLRASPWAFPLLEVLHLLGIALLLGNLILVELRLLGYARRLPLVELARAALLLAVGGFLLAAASGLLMFATQAQDLLANRAFAVKMGLLMLAGTNAAAFHARSGLARGDLVAKLQAGLSALLWLAILVCGRWIAYL
jgi:hypothetical protein